MSNRSNVKVDENFILKLKTKFEEDKLRVPKEYREKKWSIQFTEFINQFIHDQKNGLVQFDKNVHQFAQAKSSGNYPGIKTIERAFVKKEGASSLLINICGIYLYQDKWKDERVKFNLGETVPSKEGKSELIHEDWKAKEGDVTAKIKMRDSKASIKKIKAGGKIHFDIDLG